jgi:hypothetical protein
MSDNKKRVRLDENNNLVVETDNAKITKEGTTSIISGTYEISDEDVEKLLVLFNNKTIVEIHWPYSFFGNALRTGTQILTSDEAVSIISKKYKELEEDHKELQDKHMTMRGNFDNLLEKIKRYNKNRLFKLKID